MPQKTLIEPAGPIPTFQPCRKLSVAVPRPRTALEGPTSPSRPRSGSLYDEGVKPKHPISEQASLRGDSLGWALCFEIGLGVLALLLGNLTEVWPAAKLPFPPPLSALLLGLLSAVPPLAVMLAARRLRWDTIRELTEFVDAKLMPMFRNLNAGELAALSLAAGFGEELLFRGLIQAEIAEGTHVTVGILIASFVFALMHFLTPAYFVMAFVMSSYFGWLFWQSDSLWVPIMGHAAYDFLMLIYLRQSSPADKRNESEHQNEDEHEAEDVHETK